MKLMRAVMPDCREVAKTLSGDGVAAEPWGRRLMFRLHLWHCEACARFSRQLDLVCAALKEAWRVPQGPAVEAFKARLVGRLGAP